MGGSDTILPNIHLSEAEVSLSDIQRRAQKIYFKSYDNFSTEIAQNLWWKLLETYR